jgi:hypothetical protein
MPNKTAQIAEGLAAWLRFEKRCGREQMFSESYLAHPLAQLFRHRYVGRIVTEFEHPVLSNLKTGPGNKPRIDFGIGGVGNVLDVAVETKWLSHSPTLLPDIVRDLVRLDLLVPNHAQSGLLMVAGRTKDFNRILESETFLGPPHIRGAKPLLPIDNSVRSLNLRNPPAYRRAFIGKVLSAFKATSVSERIPIVCAGPFPLDARMSDYQVYVWALRPLSGGHGLRFSA